MSKFLEMHKLVLTPLSPIHIGAGEDFEPTNYVVDEQLGVLAHFQSNALPLTEKQYQELSNAVLRTDLLQIQRFYKVNSHSYAIAGDYYVKTPKAFIEEWKAKIDSPAKNENGVSVMNKLAIERHIYTKTLDQAYIPASSVKGALVTAFLDKCHQDKGNPRFDNTQNTDRLDKQIKKDYVGDFENSRYSHLSFGDFMANMPYKGTQLCYILNMKRKNGETAYNGSVRRECLLPAQYRAFSSQLTKYDQKGSSDKFKIIDDLKILHQYSLGLLQEELVKMRDLRLVDTRWANSLLNLVKSMPNAYLVRLGKTGADNKIYRGALGLAKIRIPQARKDFNRPTTWWLASSVAHKSTDMLPLGWAIIEVDPQAENQALKAWCDANAVAGVDFDVINERKAKQQAQLHQLQAEKEAKLAAEEQQKAAEAERLSKLSSIQLELETIFNNWESAEVRSHTDGSTVFNEALGLLQRAQAENWAHSDSNYLIQALNTTDGIFYRKVSSADILIKSPAKKLKNKAKEFRQAYNAIVAGLE